MCKLRLSSLHSIRERTQKCFFWTTGIVLIINGYGMATLKETDLYFRLSCIIGILLSCYALFVELKKEEDDNYEALCDINEHISCTKAFSSQYGKGFGIIGGLLGEDSKLNQPNSIAGIAFYLVLLLMSFSNSKSVIQLQTVFCIVSNFMSIYLAYILYFILHDFCVVCVATYVINALNLVLSISKWNLVKRDISVGMQSSKKSRSKKE